jgi:hypothetical protein
MLKNIIKLEFQIGTKVYHFLCDNDAPIEHAKEALFQFMKYMGQVEDHLKAQLEQSEAKKKADEEKNKIESIAEG